MHLYASAWLTRLRSSVSDPQGARGSDAHQLGLGPRALCCIVVKVNVSPEGCTLCPYILPNGHMESPTLGDKALALNLDRRSLPLLRGALG